MDTMRQTRHAVYPTMKTLPYQNENSDGIVRSHRCCLLIIHPEGIASCLGERNRIHRNIVRPGTTGSIHIRHHGTFDDCRRPTILPEEHVPTSGHIFNHLTVPNRYDAESELDIGLPIFLFGSVATSDFYQRNLDGFSLSYPAQPNFKAHGILPKSRSEWNFTLYRIFPHLSRAPDDTGGYLPKSNG